MIKKPLENWLPNCFIIEEFLKQEISEGNINAEQFTKKKATVKVHAHCHQKALSNASRTFDILNLPENYKVTIIPSGCCGMAGSFGYEKEHYEISMRIGENSLFPAIRKMMRLCLFLPMVPVAGTRSRMAPARIARHPVSILYTL